MPTETAQVHPWNNPDWIEEPEAKAGMQAWQDGKFRPRSYGLSA